MLRSDVPVTALAHLLGIAYDALVLHLAIGRAAKDLDRVVDLVEAAARR